MIRARYRGARPIREFPQSNGAQLKYEAARVRSRIARAFRRAVKEPATARLSLEANFKHQIIQNSNLKNKHFIYTSTGTKPRLPGNSTRSFKNPQIILKNLKHFWKNCEKQAFSYLKFDWKFKIKAIVWRVIKKTAWSIFGFSHHGPGPWAYQITQRKTQRFPLSNLICPWPWAMMGGSKNWPCVPRQTMKTSLP